MDGVHLLRLACAVSVVWFHYSYMGPVVLGETEHSLFPQLAQYGRLGVDVFFIISGLVIAHCATGRTAGAFGWARVRRLYPTFWVCVLLTTLAHILQGTQITAATFAANLTMAPAVFGADPVDGVYWTLLVELRFYAIVALALLLRVPLIVAAIGWLALSAVRDMLPGGVGTLLALQWAPHFVLGIALGGDMNGKRLALAAASFAMMYPQVEEVAAGFGQSGAISYAIVGAGVAALAMGARSTATVRGAAALGAMTYPLYLLHQQIGYQLITASEPMLGAVAVPTAAGAIFALSYSVTCVFVPAVRPRPRRPVRQPTPA